MLNPNHHPDALKQSDRIPDTPEKLDSGGYEEKDEVSRHD